MRSILVLELSIPFMEKKNTIVSKDLDSLLCQRCIRRNAPERSNCLARATKNAGSILFDEIVLYVLSTPGAYIVIKDCACLCFLKQFTWTEHNTKSISIRKRKRKNFLIFFISFPPFQVLSLRQFSEVRHALMFHLYSHIHKRSIRKDML